MASRPAPRLKCPVCGAAPRLPRDLRQPIKCECRAILRVSLTVERMPVDEADVERARWWDR